MGGGGGGFLGIPNIDVGMCRIGFCDLVGSDERVGLEGDGSDI